MKKERLDSWKEISAYLDKGLRTVQRWAVEYEMPVRRISGDSGPVFAYTAELDAWLKARSEGASLPVPPSESPSPEIDRGRSLELTAIADEMRRQLSENNVGSIARLYRKAIDLDHFNAVAYAHLADLQIVSALNGVVPSSIAFPRAIAAIERAFEIDPECPDAMASSALYQLVRMRDSDGARQTYGALPKIKYSYRSLLGRALLKIVEQNLPAARSFLNEAIEIDPLDVPLASILAWVRYLERDYNSAVALPVFYWRSGEASALMTAVGVLAGVQGSASMLLQIEPMLDHHGHSAMVEGAKAYLLAHSGNPEGARRTLGHLSESNGTPRQGSAYFIALTHIALGELDQAIPWLERSFTKRSLWSLAYHLDPALDPLRAHSGFVALLENMRSNRSSESLPPVG